LIVGLLVSPAVPAPPIFDDGKHDLIITTGFAARIGRMSFEGMLLSKIARHVDHSLSSVDGHHVSLKMHASVPER
jgi:hypothetical protein